MISEIDGVHIFNIDQRSDDRGWLTELFRHDCLEEGNHPVMAYVSMTLPGVVRGPHEHVNQSDYFTFVGPGEFDLHLWERRETGDGNTYVFHEKHRVGVTYPAAVIVPPGVVHAYKNVGESNGLVFNAPNELFAGPGKKYPVDEIRHEDGHTAQFYQVE